MTIETYVTVAVVIDAFAGLGFGLAFGRRRAAVRVGVALASFAAAFVGISGLVVGYEVTHGKGFVPGLAWAAMYSPVNFGLSAAAPVLCLLGILLRLSIHRRTRRCT